MWPLELVATATDSPRYSPGGSFNKFGTVVNGISGTFSMVALRWASTGAAASTARMTDEVRIRFIEASLDLIYSRGIQGGAGNGRSPARRLRLRLGLGSRNKARQTALPQPPQQRSTWQPVRRLWFLVPRRVSFARKGS